MQSVSIACLACCLNAGTLPESQNVIAAPALALRHVNFNYTWPWIVWLWAL